jgi:hypothetical protein
MIPWINMGEQAPNIAVRKVEKRWADKTGGAVRYIGGLCLKEDSGWSNLPVDVFWQERVTDPAHSNYFGLFFRQDSLVICDARSVAEGVWGGLCNRDTGEVLFSRFRHDFRSDSTGAYVDGGRDYFRCGSLTPEHERVHLRVIKSRMEIVSWAGSTSTD